MKRFIFLSLLMFVWQAIPAQCTAPGVTASGPTTLCPGGSVTLSAPAGNAWTQRADFGSVERTYAIGFSIGSKGYMGTGLSNGTTYYKDFWEFDPATNVWTQKADFGGAARASAAGFSISSKGYIGMGYGFFGYTKDLWEYDPATNVWTRKADFGGAARGRATGFSIGNKGYIGAGWNGSSDTKDFWEYDPATNVWTRKADFGGAARERAAGFSIGSKGYIGTGYKIGTFYKDFWEYDPATNVWAQKADFGGAARYGAAGFSIGSKGYIGTGYGSGYARDFWEYSPSTDTWTQKADVGGATRQYATGFSIGSKGYIGTGDNGTYFKDFWEYDPGYTYSWNPGGQTTSSINATASGNYTVTTTNAIGCSATSAATVVTVNTLVTPVITANSPTALCTGGSVTLSAPAGNTWTQKANIGGVARFDATGFSIGSKGYIGTGNNGGTNYKKDFWEYDPATNVWTQKADFGGVARTSATGFSIGSKGYIGTGIGSRYYKDFWEYDPATNTWSQKADFGGRERFGATGFSIGSKGYIGTGENDNTYYKDLWEYDPATNMWIQKADFGGAVRTDATGFSIGSKGYIGTGTIDGSNNYKDFWAYDPATNVWTQKADFGGMGRFGATGFSIGSKGYIGTGLSSNYLSDFWEYDPATNVWTPKADFSGPIRVNATCFSIGSKGYIGNGQFGNSAFEDFWEYDPGYTYTWSPGGQTTSSIIVNTTGNYTVTTTNAIGCSATSAATTITVNPATQITTPPQSTTTCKGGSVGFSVMATGSNLTFQWYRNGQPISNTSSTLTISNAQLSNAGSYTVTVTGDCGTVTSNAATLTVYDSNNGAIYVDNSVSASGDGTSWATAFRELREAMKAATQCSSITTINVATGTYKPAITDRDSSFAILRGGLKIFGGYPTGGGTRNPTANPTILSGDIGTANISSDNSYHVVVIAGLTNSADSVVIDGFTITMGTANGNGAVNNYNGAPLVNNEGAGMYLHSNNGAGGKIAVRNCRFTSNTSASYGGGFYNQLSSPLISNCEFTGNSAFTGGGMFNYNSSSPVLTNCIFSGNNANDGGGMYNYNASAAVITNCIFTANSSNTGGGMYNQAATPVVINCSFTGNTAANSGGAMFNVSATPTISNSIIWGNNTAFNDQSAAVTYSIVQGGYTVNQNRDPLFVNASDPDGADNIFGTGDDGLQLRLGSPAVNTGSNAAVPSGITTDIAGATRIQNTTVDMGAYESPYLTYSIATAVSATSICTGATIPVNYTAVGTYNSGNTFTAQLSDATGSFASPVSIGSVIATISGTINNTTIPAGTVAGTGYRIRVISSNPAVSGTDNGSNITINATPAKPAITASGTTTFCAGSSITLTAPTSASYLWSNGATTQGITVNQSGSYSVVVTNGNGCNSPSSDAIVVTVNALPAKPVITTSSPTTFCAGGSVTLTAPASSSYLWSNGAITQFITVAQSGSYSAVVTNVSGCTSPTSDITVVTVNALPGKPAVTVSGPTTFCAGGSVTLSASISSSYLWSNGATTQSVTVNQSGSYSVIVTNSNGCNNPAPDATMVTVNPIPAKPTITASGPTTFTQGGSVTLSAPAAAAYLWSNGATTQAITVSTSGTYTVSVSNSNGCKSVVSDALTIIVTAAPPPSSLSVSYLNSDNGHLTNNLISPYLQLNNESSTPVAYSSLTLRYWLTVEDFAPMTNLAIDWAQLGTNQVIMKYVKLPQPRAGAFGYIEYSFATNAGNLAAMSNSGPIQSRVGKSDWTNFNEADDYSYAAYTSYTKNNKITLYQNGNLVWGTEPATVTAVQSLKAWSQDKSHGTTTNILSPWLKVNNEGNIPVSYKDITVRYWFTSEGSQPLNYVLDYAQLGSNNVTSKFVKLTTPLNDADTYLEVGFSAADSLYPISTTGDLQHQISKNDWSNFSQVNDHSYKPGSAMSENVKVTVYVKGVLVYGTEPTAMSIANSSSTVQSIAVAVTKQAIEAEAKKLTVTVLNNPVMGSEVVLIVRGAQDDRLQVTLSDAQGKIISVKEMKQAGVTERISLSVSNSAATTLFVRVSTSKEMKTVKVMRIN